jgi:murein DD-endopeptidase MepM/ murein hydrolase activator NlpD
VAGRHVVAALALTAAACNAERALPAPSVAPALQCRGYDAEATSAYRLPYATGAEFLVSQGNCSVAGPTHHPGSVFKYGYDFRMAIGTPIHAAREGTVIGTHGGFVDFNAIAFDTNYVFVRHDDGTVARYFHLTPGGVLVGIGDRVAAGQPLGLSGASGLIDDPHLHFDVVPEPCPARDCTTVAVTFNNTAPHPQGLVEGQRYRANATR